MYDAIVLAGGAGRRLGGLDKPQLRIGDATLLDRVLGAVAAAERVIVVGPRQPAAGAVTFCREEPPGGGPVAGIAAGLPHTRAAVVLVLAADLPWVAPAVPALVDALPERGAALLVDTNGRPNYLAAAWRRRDLAAALEQLGDPHGLPVHALAARVEQVHVTDPAGWGRDCDTWDDLAEARSHEKDAR